jgi:DNA-binding beta-propeller fold protein YncE
MAAFLSRTVDRVLQRGGRRAALRQFWTTQSNQIALTATFAGSPRFVEFDGADLWVSQSEAGQVSRIRASDGKLLETWTGLAASARGVLIAMGKVFVPAQGTGTLYRIDPSLPAGAASTVATGLPTSVFGIAFDGGRIWTTNLLDGSVSIVTPGATLPWTVTTTGAFVSATGILYDGANIWITDSYNTGRTDQGPQIGALLKLNASGGVLQTITLGEISSLPVYDGANIWVPNSGDSTVSVVRASNGSVLATLTGNGMLGPIQAAFDGQRVLVTNNDNDTVSLWKAADLTPLGSFPMPFASVPIGACSDGVSFWVTLFSSKRLARF